jgi:AcrR family transcriptional regulator
MLQPRSRRVSRPPMTDDHLLAAARAVIAETGLHHATLARIAETAGVSRVTLHRRGVTKDDLVNALIERAAESYQKAMWAALTAGGDALARLRQALEVLCAQAEEHLALLVGLRAEGDPGFHEEAAEVLTSPVFTEPLERLLRDGMTEGSVRELDPATTATLLFNMVGWSYIQLRSGHRWPPERAATSTIDLALHGVLHLDGGAS